MGGWNENGKTAGPYLFYGYGLLNLELSHAADAIAKKIEYDGYNSIPFPPTYQVSSYRDRMARANGELVDESADLSHRHAAVAAGLGEFGWHGLLLTPEFGTRQRLTSIITNAPLIGDPLYGGEEL